jgi:glyoxylase-like metal-dependent hydrolase (beta-lactamase superfamily II)/ferredoxin
VADPAARHRSNARGAWFTDTTCIDCDTCVQLAPSLFAHRGGQVVVAQQPGSGADDRLAATRALHACPVGAIGGEPVKPRPDAPLFPLHLGATEAGAGVYYCGYASPDSFGASAYLVTRPEGNLMIDAPRFVAPLARAIAGLGGIAHVLLSHQDDVADAARWAREHGARVWIHERERGAAPFATDLVRGDDPAAPTAIADGVVAIPVPGHTRGSLMFLVDDDALFTGDSLHWSRALGRLSAFPDACWYSWDAQAASLARLAAHHRFGWILPGHGDRRRLGAAEAHAQVVALVERMGAAPDGEGEY